METGDKDPVSRFKSRLEQVPAHNSQHSIYKVPRTLRLMNNKAYEPEMVAIGPYHHGKEKFEMMEEVKVRYMQSLLQWKPEVPVDSYLSAIAQVEVEARDCYAESIMPNSEFVEMLVLDGCFIIQLIGGDRSHEHTTYFPSRLWGGLHRDLMLLENQVPFFVLCRLFDLIEGPGKHENLMSDVLLYYEGIFPVEYKVEMMEKKSREAKHILDLIHRHCILTSPSPSCNVQITTTGSLLIPSASKLKDANVKFRRKEISCHSLFDVEFKKCGKMLMPTLDIDDSTESVFKNLIAYEQSQLSSQRTPFTDYALLLDRLIDSAEDVEILSSCGIIDNRLGNNQAVADFVNQLTVKIIYYRDNFMYSDIFDRINNHHKNPWNIALAQFRRDYFASPWIFISVVAAAVLLLLTVAQTVFAALQQFK